ncbi:MULTISPECIES: zinc-dependent metalloprotease [unclassified Streptomyces]|uniref:zinc-dependent metalloprotease n=1 Tax=unclassified Streptomyces TaxID=2593676 RepID=UPI0021562EE7|nr:MULTISPECIES: zinc-dependent metalloprotease [unclassified Streptomyces]
MRDPDLPATPDRPATGAPAHGDSGADRKRPDDGGPDRGAPVRLLTGAFSDAAVGEPGAVGSGRLLLAVRRFDTPFLLAGALASGVGSSELGLDRGRIGKARLAEFRRIGGHAVLVATPKHRLARGGRAAVRAGAESFAHSVLWSAPVLRDTADGALVDAGSLALLDVHGVAEQLAERGQGEHTVAPDASFPLVTEATDGPRGVRLPALLTFRGAPGDALRRVVPLPGNLSVVQHLHLVPLPDEPLAARPYHPASGGYGIGHHDHGTRVADGTAVALQPRFRTRPEPTPTTPPGDGGRRRPEAAIVFLIDPAIPEPWRSAVVEGGNWWRAAFDAAGLPGVFRVEVAPEDADLHDLAHNTVLWVHRDGRGWSHGQALTDPRSGEILSGRVRLGSQRLEQVTALAETLLAPYGHPDEAKRLAAVRETVLGRMRQLAAHEIGHALGFMHNFASGDHPVPSVMDYPHPRVTLTGDGTPDLSDAYHQGLGPWDHFLVAHAYGPAGSATDTVADRLAALRREAAARGLRHLADEDAQGPGAANADGAVWLPHLADPFQALSEALAVRRAALAGFSRGVLPPDRQSGELESRAALAHLYHRHALAAVARQVGGVRYAYGHAGDAAPDDPGTTPVPASGQWRALRAAADLLDPAELALPAGVLRLLTPPAIRYERTREYLDTRAGRVFDPFAAVEVAAALVAEALLEPARLTRVAAQHAVDPEQPGPAAVADTLLDACWPGAAHEEPLTCGGGDAPRPARADSEVRATAGWVVLRHLAAAIGGEALPPTVRETLKGRLHQLADRLDIAGGGPYPLRAGDRGQDQQTARTLRAFLAAPTADGLGPLPRVPPGAPL